MTVYYDSPRFSGVAGDVVAAEIGVGRAQWNTAEEATAEAEAQRKMKAGRYDVLPILKGEVVVGYFRTARWNDYASVTRQSITHKDVVPAWTPVRDLIKGFAAPEARTFYFLSDGQRAVGGLVTVADINKRQVQVYLYRLLNELETRLGELVSKSIPEAELEDLASSSDAKDRFRADRSSGLDVAFVEYLYLADLLNIARKKALYKQLGYSSSKFEDLNSLNDLRLRVAHPTRSLLNKEQPVDKLWSRIERMEDCLFRLRQQAMLTE